MPEASIQTDWGSQFSRGLWRYIRPSFRAAGQDSFSDPPSQNEDMFESLVNVMPPVQGDFDRRWGYRSFNLSVTDGASTNAVPYPMGFWNDDPAVSRLVIAQDSTNLVALGEDGSFVSTIGAFFTGRTINSRGWLYIADGSFVNRNKAWVPSTGLRNWGIDVANNTIGSVANYAGTGANSGGGGVAWSNPSNCTGAPNAAVASVVLNRGQASQDLKATNYSFSIPANAVITGIQVSVTYGEVSTNSTGSSLSATLIKAGGSLGFSKSIPYFHISSGLNTVTLGGSNDLWGNGWTPSDINNSGFGVAFGAGLSNIFGSPGSNTFEVDSAQITVFYSGPITVGAPTGTGVTLVSGRIYFVTFYNSSAGVYSDLNIPSVSTGPITNQSIPLSTIPVSNDPQVDRKKILATADGGDEETLYELADLANATTTFTDTVDEATLLLSNQWQAVLIDGTSVGVADNTPPPLGMQFPTTHRGRVYGLLASNLFYSKSEDELVTPTGAIAGRFEEAWPALNFFPVSATAEQGRGLLSDGTVLYIGTDRRIVRLFGDGPATFLQPHVLFDNVGILNQDVWKLLLIEGNPIGAMWLTPDYRVLGSDFNTYQDVGIPVQDVLNTVNPAAIKTAWAANVNISIFNLYVLAVPTGSNTQPDTLLVFDVKGRKWYTWKTTDTLVGGAWWVTLGGIPLFVVQASTGKFYQFDPTLFQDRVNDTPVNFPVTLRTSWLPLGDGTARKHLNEIEISTGDSGMVLTVESANTVAEFFTPLSVVANAPLVVKPRGELAVFLAGASTRGKYYRFTFSATDTATDILRSFSIQGKVLHRI